MPEGRIHSAYLHVRQHHAQLRCGHFVARSIPPTSIRWRNHGGFGRVQSSDDNSSRFKIKSHFFLCCLFPISILVFGLTLRNNGKRQDILTKILSKSTASNKRKPAELSILLSLFVVADDVMMCYVCINGSLYSKVVQRES